MLDNIQLSLFGDDSVSEHLRAIDELLTMTAAYRRSQGFLELIHFLAKFTRYSLYNAFLLYVQNPQVTFVATPAQWKKRHGRRVKPGARPLLILAPMHPVLFVYDLMDTEGRPIPDYLLQPYSAMGEISPNTWIRTQNKALHDGILTSIQREFSHLQAGEARRMPKPVMVAIDGKTVACHFEILVNVNLPLNARYATLVHELGHLYAGHLGPIPRSQVPDRGYLHDDQVEIEAETISYLVCRRLGIQTTSEKYLALKAKQDIELPDFSLDMIIRVAGRIESMGKAS